jgi:hypothetical protein
MLLPGVIKSVEVSLLLLDRTWIGSVIEAVIGKTVVTHALAGLLRLLQNLAVNSQIRG